jgi:RNA polymerase sigma-70 factor (ECF subfamily)
MPIAAVRQDEAFPQELEELFHEHCQMVHRTAYAITGHRQDAEDVLQSMFVKLLQRGLTPEVRQHPARYLHRAAVNLSLNVLRTRKRRRLVDGIDTLEIPARGDEHEDVRERDERHERLMEAMSGLKPRALEILLLHYKHDYTDAQIAALLGTSRGTIAVTLFRIRARLRTLLRTAGLPTKASAKVRLQGDKR